MVSETEKGLAKLDPSPSREGTRHRLLLVEDDPASRKALKAIMGRQGWEVSAATCLSEAWPLLDSGTDVLILDLMLPDGDGISMLQRVRDEARPITVIVTTGSSDERKLERVRGLRPDSLLLKPVDLDQLLVAIGPPGPSRVAT